MRHNQAGVIFRQIQQRMRALGNIAVRRAVETVAAQVFITRSFEVLRPDILQALNRLSSTVYVMMILSVTKQPLTVKQIQQRLGETQ